MVKTKDQKSLVLYLETRIVDHSGRVDARHMNEDDFEQAEAWARAGFIGFGRIIAKDATAGGAHWARFTDEAWAAAHGERRAKADRTRTKRTYQTTEEKGALSTQEAVGHD